LFGEDSASLYITCKARCPREAPQIMLLFWGNFFKFRLLCCGVPHVPKNIGDGLIKWLLLELLIIRKKTMGAPPL